MRLLRPLRPLPLLALTVAACLAVAGGVTVLAGDRGSADVAAGAAREAGGPPARAIPLPAAPVAGPGTVRALAVLRGWDEARAAAYASGDVAALRRLYAPGAAAGREDVRTLRAYVERGLTVERLELQRFEASVLRDTGRRLRLQVVERLARATVVGAGGEASLPRASPQRRVVTFIRERERGRGRWRVAAVAISAAPPRSGR